MFPHSCAVQHLFEPDISVTSLMYHATLFLFSHKVQKVIFVLKTSFSVFRLPVQYLGILIRNVLVLQVFLLQLIPFILQNHQAVYNDGS